ncbi:MAG: TspO/MBR family protein [Pseudomonadota bacterium]
MKKAALFPIGLAAFLAFMTAVIGSTITVLDEWYYSLQQPPWAPPDWLFGIAWTIIFAMIALAGYLAWFKAPTRRDIDYALTLFALNGFLNLLWSFLFFRLQRPDWAFYELTLLWLSILMLIIFCARFSRGAALLLLPYLVWVSFAGALNFQIVHLNAPFG